MNPQGPSSPLSLQHKVIRSKFGLTGRVPGRLFCFFQLQSVKIITQHSKLGFRFVRVVKGCDQNGRPQLEAEHAGRVFVQSKQPNWRGDVVKVGDEVIVAKPEGKPSFVRDGGRIDCYIVHLHPVAAPTPAMEAAATPSHLVPAVKSS